VNALLWRAAGMASRRWAQMVRELAAHDYRPGQVSPAFRSLAVST
jgi:hypothetical protein